MSKPVERKKKPRNKTIYKYNSLAIKKEITLATRRGIIAIGSTFHCTVFLLKKKAGLLFHKVQL